MIFISSFILSKLKLVFLQLLVYNDKYCINFVNLFIIKTYKFMYIFFFFFFNNYSANLILYTFWQSL